MKHIFTGFIFTGFVAATLVTASPASAEPSAAPSTTDSRQLDAAWNEFQQAITDSVAFVRQHPFYRDAENKASAYAFLSSMMLARIEEEVVFDGDFPYFRVLDHRFDTTFVE